MKFEELDLDPGVLDAIRALNYLEPTKIQEKAIPEILDGSDIIGLAETGSGKTAACVIPICSKIDCSHPHIQALIIVPTRELALQYAQEAQKIGKVKGVVAFTIFGGEDMDLQRAKLKDGVHLLVATPGRLIDFIYSRSIDLTSVKSLVLDEADQMLSLGFYEDLQFVMQCLVQEHQTLLFSATMPKEISLIAKEHMHKPKEIALIGKKPAPKNLTHKFCMSPSPQKKHELLIKVLKDISPDQCLIFTNSRREVEKIYYELKRQFSPIDFLHGGLEQRARSSITAKFIKRKLRFLVATDVASRGLDFSGVTHVINFHLPFEDETYMHRAGRTARAGREGTCITLVTKRDQKIVDKICKTIGKKPIWLSL